MCVIVFQSSLPYKKENVVLFPMKQFITTYQITQKLITKGYREAILVNIKLSWEDSNICINRWGRVKKLRKARVHRAPLVVKDHIDHNYMSKNVVGIVN